MAIDLSSAAAELCQNICDSEKEFCVRLTQYPGPYFCIDKNLFKRGLRFKEKQMKRNAFAASDGTDILSAFILIFAIITLAMTLFELYKLRKINRNAGHELQSFDNINHVDHAQPVERVI
uniref:Uncharacterized protein n=1 Tax=Panagrolaimus sp. PS1159 TaxID=55785 RepID=A0AC35FP59_9BILA